VSVLLPLRCMRIAVLRDGKPEHTSFDSDVHRHYNYTLVECRELNWLSIAKLVWKCRQT